MARQRQSNRGSTAACHPLMPAGALTAHSASAVSCLFTLLQSGSDAEGGGEYSQLSRYTTPSPSLLLSSPKYSLGAKGHLQLTNMANNHIHGTSGSQTRAVLVQETHKLSQRIRHLYFLDRQDPRAHENSKVGTCLLPYVHLDMPTGLRRRLRPDLPLRPIRERTDGWDVRGRRPAD